jgi:hypothetical protein
MPLAAIGEVALGQLGASTERLRTAWAFCGKIRV